MTGKIRHPDITPERVKDLFLKLGDKTAVGKALGCSADTVKHRLAEVGIMPGMTVAGGVRDEMVKTRKLPLPKKGEVKRYVLTSAQNNTHLHPAWESIRAMAEHRDAELLVSRFTYKKDSYGAKSVKPGWEPTNEDIAERWYDPRMDEYVNDESLELAPGLVWCGEWQIEPTAVTPLSGLNTYTGRASSVFPHPKIQIESVPSMKNEATKFILTTGAITRKNYIHKKAGLRASFHHAIAALLVEVDHEGRWYCRHINADKQGRVYDLTDCATQDGKVTTDHRVEAITWGDIHRATIDEEVRELAWGAGGMIDTLQPRYQFMHDLPDFRARNGHTAKKRLCHDRFRDWCRGHDSVEAEMLQVAEFVTETTRDYCTTVVVHSNHDDFFTEWLRIGDYRTDPVNARYFLKAQSHMYDTLWKNPDADPNLLRWSIERCIGAPKNVRILDSDESFVICKRYGDGVECGLHGHQGPNGARGTPRNVAKMGRKINEGHHHSAGAFEGVWTAGLTGSMDQGYNSGPSSWSHSHIITYPNSKRALVTMWNGKWRA